MRMHLLIPRQIACKPRIALRCEWIHYDESLVVAQKFELQFVISIFGFAADQRSCLKGYLAEGSNRNDHVIAEEGTMGWRILRGNNLFDLELYDYALQLYEEQGKMLGSL
jgi:hypothetical protein